MPDIRDYNTGEWIGEAPIDVEFYRAYRAYAQWPEGIIAAGDLLDATDLDRLGLDYGQVIWIEG